MAEENLEAFMDHLKSYGKVFGPKKIDECYYFMEIGKPNEMTLKYSRTMSPPKKFFLTPKETLFTFDEYNGIYNETIESMKFVLFGVHPCDIYALKLMDKIYLDKIPDKYYQTKRENATIIGYDCHPDEYCFCQSQGTDYAADGFDIFFHELGGKFLLRVGSIRGNAIVSKSSRLMKEATSGDILEFREAERRRGEQFTLKLDISGLPSLLALAYESSELWKEYADRCFGCGNCNLVCPTCRCFDIIDQLNPDLTTGERIRILDSCTLRKHGLVGGGLNFRPTRVERLRNRFSCKGSLREEMLNCVGCGRCTVYCPSKIDYVEVMKKVRGEL